VALAWCSWELSTYCMVATPRMLFNRRHTMPPSLVGVADSAFRRAASVATFWLAVVKAGSCYSLGSSMARLASNANSCWSTSASLASAATLSPVSLP
jgi:hypothetical protein